MKSYKKMLAAVMAAAMLFSIAGCSKNDSSSESSGSTSDSAAETTDNSEVQTGDSSASDDSTTAETVIAEEYFDSTPVGDSDTVVMSINGNDITLAEYRYYFLNIKSSYDYGDNSYWNGEAYESDEGEMVSAEQAADDKLAALKEQVLTYLKNNYTVESFAASNNVSLSDDEVEKAKKQYSDDVEKYKAENSFSDDDWKNYLDSIYCTEDLYQKSVIRQNLEYKTIRTLYEDDFKENVLSNYVMAKHILFSTNNPQYDEKEIPEGATDEEIADITAQNEKLKEEAAEKLKKEKRAIAEEVLAKAKNGEDFDELIAEYNEDPGETPNDDGKYDGYLFTTGEMVEEFETAAFALGIDEISDIVETDYGYHIIKRVDISDKYLEDNIVDIMMTNDTYYQKYSTAVKELLDTVDIQYNDDVYNKINIMSLT